MKVGIIGSGGREHALCLSIKKSPKVHKIYCFPGNAGTSNIAENIEIDLSDFNKIKEFSIKNEIGLLIVGPEKPLVDGIVDFFRDIRLFHHFSSISDLFWRFEKNFLDLLDTHIHKNTDIYRNTPVADFSS